MCFFSAWDFHLPPDGTWQLIEFNDNGSGFLFAATINALYYEAAGLRQEETIVAPARWPAFNEFIGDLVQQEATTFFGERFADSFLVLDDSELLQRGKFRRELELLCDLLRHRGWQAELGCPADLRWDGRQLLFKEQALSFIINRSTDFFWQSNHFVPLWSAIHAGAAYVAPNPFTYATRSDKRLLEWLSLPDWDRELEIEPRERQILSGHVPETHVVRLENVDELAHRKQEFVFKPLHGFRRARPARQRCGGAGALAPSGSAGLCGAETGSETLPGNRWSTNVERSSCLGLPGRDLSSFRTCLTAARPAGSDAPWRMAADLRMPLTPVD